MNYCPHCGQVPDGHDCPKRPACPRCRDTGRDFMDRLCPNLPCEARQRRIRDANRSGRDQAEFLADLLVRLEALEEAEAARRTRAMERSER